MICKKIFVIFLFIFTVGTYAKRKRIIGGSNAYIRDFPHLVSFRNDLNEHFCSGSIISRLHILSAGHCFIDYINELFRIKIYSGTSSSIHTSGDVHEIDNVIFHPGFSWNFYKSRSPRDICIVKVKHEIQFTDLQKKIKLPSRDVFDENLAIIAGWGLSHFDRAIISSKLLKAPVGLYNYIMCSNILMIFVFEDQFCSGHTQGIEVVPTDTGGSVTSNGELYGVISINNENRNRLFAIHTKVYAYLQFIRDVVGTALEN